MLIFVFLYTHTGNISVVSDSIVMKLQIRVTSENETSNANFVPMKYTQIGIYENTKPQ